jgi:hypothetical protein
MESFSSLVYVQSIMFYANPSNPISVVQNFCRKTVDRAHNAPQSNTYLSISNQMDLCYQENSDATRVGKSEKNRKWLNTAYGDTVIKAMEGRLVGWLLCIVSLV